MKDFAMPCTENGRCWDYCNCPRGGQLTTLQSQLFSTQVIAEIRTFYFDWLNHWFICDKKPMIISSTVPYTGGILPWYSWEEDERTWRLWNKGFTWRGMMLKRGEFFVPLSKIEKKRLYAAWQLAKDLQKIYKQEAKRLKQEAEQASRYIAGKPGCSPPGRK